MLTSRYAMWMALGPGADLLLQRRLPPDPRASSTPGRSASRPSEVWAEIWPDIGPRIEHVLTHRRGHLGRRPAAVPRAQRLSARRPTTPSPTARSPTTTARSPACSASSPRRPSASSASGGWARCATWRPRSAGDEHARTSCSAPSRAPARTQPADLPFTLTYLFDDERHGRLAWPRSRDRGRPPGGARHDRRHADRALAARRARWRPATPLIDRSRRHASADLPTGAWDQPPDQALIVPLAQQGQDSSRPASSVVGLNPYRAARRRAIAASSTCSPARSPPALANAPRLRGGAPARRGAGRARPRQDRLLLQRQPRVPHAADADARPARGRAGRARGCDRARRSAQVELAHRNGAAPAEARQHACSTSRASRPAASQARFEPTDLAAFTAELASPASARRSSGPACASRVDCRAAARAGLRRPRHVGEDRPQPALQRLQVHLRGRDRASTSATVGRRQLRRADGARHRHRHPAARAAAPVRALPPRRGRPGPHATRAPASASRWCRSWSSCTAATIAVGERSSGAGTDLHRVAIPFGTAHLPADRIARQPRRPAGAHAGPRPSSRRRCAGCRTAAGDRRSRPIAAARSTAPGRPRRRPAAHPAGRRQRRHARLRAAPAGARRATRSRPSPTARRRSTPRARRAARPGPHRRHDAAARRLRPAARAPRRPGAGRHARSSCCRRAPARRPASRGSTPAPTTIWSSRSPRASCWRACRANLEMARMRRETEAEAAGAQRQTRRAGAAEVDERLKAEEALRQAQKMEAVGQLTGGVAHDFNNLLTVIIGGLDTHPAQRAGGRRAAAPGRSTWRCRAPQRAASLTARLLAFSRRQPLEPKPLDLNALVRDMTELLHRTLGETIELEGVLAPAALAGRGRPEPARERDPQPGGQRARRHAGRRQADHRDRQHRRSTRPTPPPTPR